MPYASLGQFSFGGQAQPSLATQGLTLSSSASSSLPTGLPIGTRGPANSGILYSAGGGGTTPGFGQIFPTGRS